jgi:hypothetical protein
MSRMPEPVEVPVVVHRPVSGLTTGRWDGRSRGLLEGLLAHSLDAITINELSLQTSS